MGELQKDVLVVAALAGGVNDLDARKLSETGVWGRELIAFKPHRYRKKQIRQGCRRCHEQIEGDRERHLVHHLATHLRIFGSQEKVVPDDEQDLHRQTAIDDGLVHQ